MVLAKGTSTTKKGSDQYVHGMSCISMIDPVQPEIGNGNDQSDGRFMAWRSVAAEKEKKEEDEEDQSSYSKVEAAVALLKNNNNINNTCSSSSTSSIGKDSDINSGCLSRGNNDCGDADEVQSSYKGPLDAMEGLEEVLPMRRGISNFYNGKSKSFACLTDASPNISSIKELAKPENAYIRRRRNLLASSNLVWDSKNKNSLLKSNSAGISKRVTNTNRSTLALAVTMANNQYHNNFFSHPYSTSAISDLSPALLLRARLHSQFKDNHQFNGSSPSLSPRLNFQPCRSLSLADLQHCVTLSAIACTAPQTDKPSQTDTDPSQT
ncbi:OLC1v1032910C1 [Oldenlandia corymbosa var. corymbosa]|uniref:OLC1v1032910C1 n=1 Tax=Oldenlandia corymbosa var. corymbosa TaxID=529605 RepID=A0AAV1CNJ0_OLDCO|nr:OLC1v1032910C1 [Oldenlandia corymbosa var. corymbosa]